MVNKNVVIVAVIGGAVLIGAIILTQLSKGQSKYQLIISHNEHGTTDPESGTRNLGAPASITIQAHPNTDYQTNWNINGQDVAENQNSYTLYVDGIYTVAVNFVPIGGGGIIAGIKSLGSVGLLENFRFWYGNPFAAIDIAECDENWRDGICSPQNLRFQVYDAAERGIPNIQVRIYPDLNPDSTTYRGYLSYYPSLPLWDIDHPLILRTDRNGVVSIPIFNFYRADDILVDGGGTELSRGTGLGVTKCLPLQGCPSVTPVWHGWAASIGGYIGSNFGGGTIGPIGKIIRAEVLGTDKSTLQNIQISYGVKWQA